MEWSHWNTACLNQNLKGKKELFKQLSGNTRVKRTQSSGMDSPFHFAIFCINNTLVEWQPLPDPVQNRLHSRYLPKYPKNMSNMSTSCSPCWKCGSEAKGITMYLVLAWGLLWCCWRGWGKVAISNWDLDETCSFARWDPNSSVTFFF